MRPRPFLTATALVPFFRSVAFAGEGTLDSGDTGWVLVATALLWFGWFGFNAGSQLAADGIASGVIAGLVAITPGAVGLFFGNPGQLWIQFVSVVATVAYSAVVTLAVIVPIGYVTSGLRVDKEEEITGLDSSIHGERAFELF